jgi:hypothetical protein
MVGNVFLKLKKMFLMLKIVNILGVVSCARHGIPLLPSHYFVPLATLAKHT